jgi:glycosyltransferase involved in cell wall biosynthesis
MPAEPEQPTVSFVVIAHNEAAGIERVLGSILAQEGVVDRELIVVDDGSADNTPARLQALARAHPELRLVRLERNRGRGFARATGVRLARGDVVAMVDADVILPPDWASACLRALTCADAVGGTAVPDGDVAYICGRFELTPRTVPHATKVTGSNAIYRRELFDRISFDPALRDGEDVAFNHALRAIGARVVTLEGLTVEHRETKDLAGTFAWLYQSGRGATRQLYRYREVRRPDLAFAGWLASGAAAALGARRSRSRSAALPLLYAVAAAAAHVSRAFVFERRTADRFVAAVLLDAALLSAYFAGRVAGMRGAVAAPVEAEP